MCLCVCVCEWALVCVCACVRARVVTNVMGIAAAASSVLVCSTPTGSPFLRRNEFISFKMSCVNSSSYKHEKVI